MAILSISPVAAASAADTPDAVVKALYHSCLNHFGFDRDSIKATKPWVAPELYARMWKKANEPVPQGDAPDIEGDLFFNAQDLPTKYEIGATTLHQADAQVDVIVKFDEEKRHYIVLLKQINGAWKVYDVNYGKDGKLTDLLK